MNAQSTWRQDTKFLEMSCYKNTDGLEDPGSSGYNLIGAGGQIPADTGNEDDNVADQDAVIFYLQRLDDGANLEVRLTPKAARLLAGRLNEWAEDAEVLERPVEEAIEDIRTDYHGK